MKVAVSILIFVSLFGLPLQTLADPVDDLVSEALSGAKYTELSSYALQKNVNVDEFCDAILKAKSIDRKAWLSLVTGAVSFLTSKGLSPKTCTERNGQTDLRSIRDNKPSSHTRTATNSWTKETYNIDLLKIETRVSHSSRTFCDQGSETVIRLMGVIGPDSSFAMSRLLERLPRCLDQKGAVKTPPIAILNSGGGLLDDGYKLGNTLRQQGVTVVIENQKSCASSCAVAFLGGAKRIIEDEGQIMFHAPYFSGRNELGVRDIDCDVGEQALAELRNYYISMTDIEIGERLFERTMWYCSADDGWVVTGGAAAELYGIATER